MGPIVSPTASSCNIDVSAGPIEATALGNVAVQFMSSGDIGSLKEARKIIKNSFDIKNYSPQNPEDWEKAYTEFRKIVVKK